MLGIAELWQLALVLLGLRLSLVGAETVIEVMHHLGFDERQVALALADEVVAFKAAAFLLQLRTAAEETGIVCHVQHRHESEPPKIPFGIVFPPKDTGPSVDGEVDVSVAAGTESRARSGVGVELGKVFL